MYVYVRKASPLRAHFRLMPTNPKYATSLLRHRVKLPSKLTTRSSTMISSKTLRLMRWTMAQFCDRGRLSTDAFLSYWHERHGALARITMAQAKSYYRQWAKHINSTLTLQSHRAQIDDLTRELREQQSASEIELHDPTLAARRRPRDLSVTTTRSMSTSTGPEPTERRTVISVQTKKRRSENYCSVCNWPQAALWHHRHPPLLSPHDLNDRKRLVCEAATFDVPYLPKLKPQKRLPLDSAKFRACVLSVVANHRWPELRAKLKVNLATLHHLLC